MKGLPSQMRVPSYGPTPSTSQRTAACSSHIRSCSPPSSSTLRRLPFDLYDLLDSNHLVHEILLSFFYPGYKHVTGGVLAQAVIFIFEHSKQGSAGLILNKPTQYTIGTMSGLEALCPEFSDNGLFLVSLLCPMCPNGVKE